MKEIHELVALNRAFELFETKANLARAFGVTPQNVTQWVKKGTFPPKIALSVEELTEGKITARQVLVENRLIDNCDL